MNIKLILLVVISLLLVSCGSSKSVTYLQEAETLPANSIPQTIPTVNAVVMPGDLIDIIISGFNVEAVKPFNRNVMVGEVGGSNGGAQNSSSSYLVDDNGNIDFPVVGKLHIGGMNKSQIKELISNELAPKYLSEAPTIDIRFKNFKVSVLGEVQTPGIYTAENERLNILEALAKAGDLSITGKRDNVMLIRTNSDGTRSVYRLNLMDKNLILSPYYELQQNDVIYVQPNSSKARQAWSIPPALTLTLSTVGTLISIATLVITLTK